MKNQESTDQNKDASRQDSASAYVASTLQQGMPNNPNDFLGTADKAPMGFSEGISPAPDTFPTGSTSANNAEGDFPWEMIGLGLDEPLPPQDVVDDLSVFSMCKQGFLD